MANALNNDTKRANKQTYLTSLSRRKSFLEWLYVCNRRKLSPSVCMSCLDKISEYVIQKKICSICLWDVTHYNEYKPIYLKVLDSKLLRLTDRRTYKEFVVAGQLYLKYLREKSFSDKNYTSSKDVKEDIHETRVTIIRKQHKVIDSKAVVSWLTTQLNANGTLYLENVVKQYISYLHSAPDKLNMPLSMGKRNVFACHSVEELNTLWESFKKAPNYKLVNNKTHGSFSAGLSCLSRYLDHITKNQEDNKVDVNNLECMGLINWLYTQKDKLPIIEKRDKGGALWIIGGRELDAQISYLKKNGFIFNFKAGGGRSSEYKDAWWYKGADFILENTLTEISGNCFSSININSTPQDETQHITISAIKKTVVRILSVHFPNGFRADSPIELMRFRHFSEESSADDISLTDEELKRTIILSGILFDGKVFIVGEDAKSKLQKEIDTAISYGVEVIYYASLYLRYENWLFGGNIISGDMLKSILKKLYPKYVHKAKYFEPEARSGNELIKIKKELLRVWGDDVLLNYEQLSVRLPFISISKIKYVLSQNGEFVWNSVGVYARVSKVDISCEDKITIVDYVASAYSKDGYASLKNIPTGDIVDHNPELSLTAILNTIFTLVLAKQYGRRGKIIMRKGDTLDALSIMKKHCRTIDRCSLKNLLDYERELTGETHRWIPMDAGYSTLVRIDKDNFVAERFVQFNTEAIDDAISLFVIDNYLPLKSITTFAAFPHCGQAWNLFLLESYCRRFSKRFRFDTLAVNSQNTGVITHKNCGLNYFDIMADAIVMAGLEPVKFDTIEFLYSNGYIGRRYYSKINNLIDIAKTRLERGV